MRKLLFGVVIVMVAASGAEAEALPKLQRFSQQLEQLVKSRYPEAKFKATERTATFSDQTMDFMIHVPRKSGEWQAAREMRGPKRQGGIQGEIELREGKWAGAAVVPQSFDLRYFTHTLMAPYSEGCDCHLMARLEFPDTVDQKFVQEWKDLVNGFEAYLGDPAEGTDSH